MTQDPYRLATDIIRLVRNFPISAKGPDVKCLLIDMLTTNGYTVPEPEQGSVTKEAETDVDRFITLLDPIVAQMSVGDVKIILDEALKDQCGHREDERAAAVESVFQILVS